MRAGDEPEALDGLGRALWWLRDPRGAVVNRERAYAGFPRRGELARAARIALWPSREYALVWGNAATAGGWIGRAERLLGSARREPIADGWSSRAPSGSATRWSPPATRSPRSPSRPPRTTSISRSGPSLSSGSPRSRPDGSMRASEASRDARTGPATAWATGMERRLDYAPSLGIGR